MTPADPPVPASNGRELPLLLAAALAIGAIALSLYPTGFNSGPSDHQRYLEISLAWWRDGPQVGTTHWSLRHPLILSNLAAFDLYGVRIEALGLVPRFYALALIAVSVVAVRRLAGIRAAWIWLALFLASPILHQMATTAYPETVELAFAAAALWALWFAGEGRRGLAMLALSGALLGLAVITRETAAMVLPVMAAKLWLDRRGLPALVALGAGIALVVGVDALWLWAETGDPLYRFHVDAAHTTIRSNHMRGGTFDGSPFFSPELASRWIPAGPTKLHWTINPILDFLIDPRFGLIFAAWLLADWRWRPHGDAYARLRVPLLLVALSGYLIVCWALMLRPQPRYFLIPTYAATIAVAMLAARAWQSGTPQRLQARAAVAILVAVGVLTIVRGTDRERFARQLLPYLAQHPATYYVNERTANRLKYWMAQQDSPSRLTTAPPPLGALRFRTIGEPLPITAGERWIEVDRVEEGARPWHRTQPFKRGKPILVEKRVR